MVINGYVGNNYSHETGQYNKLMHIRISNQHNSLTSNDASLGIKQNLNSNAEGDSPSCLQPQTRHHADH